MKKILSIFLVLAMCTSALLSLTSCEPKDAGAEISVNLGNNVYDFDPTDYYEDTNADQLMSLLYEPLFRLGSNGKLEYGIAKSYEIDEDQNKIVIQLRESYWSDEIRVKAADFIYSWRDVILEPNNPNPAAALLYDIENAVEIKSGTKSIYEFGATATDVYEITIQCREGANYDRLLANLAAINTSPLREDIVSQAKTYWSKSLSIIVSNGPFKINSINYETGEFSISRNLGYHQPSSAKNYTSKVTPSILYTFISADGESLNLTYSDVEDKTVFYLANTSLEDRAENEANATVANDLSTYSYVFNVKNPLFAIPEVRKALSLALNREEMAKAVVFATAANGFIPTVMSGLENDRISTGENIDEAKELLKNVNFNGLSKVFTLTINDDAASVAMAELAKASWRELGFTVSINKLSAKKTTIYDSISDDNIEIVDSAIQVLLKEAAYGNCNFDVIGINWQMYSNDPFVALCSFTSHMNGNGVDCTKGTNRLNISGWWSAEYDVLMNAAYNAKTEEDRENAINKAEELLLESAPIIPVVYNTSFAFVNEDLKNVRVDGFGNFVLTKIKLKDYEKYLEQ